MFCARRICGAVDRDHRPRVQNPRKIFDTVADNGARRASWSGGQRPMDIDLRWVVA